MGEAWLKKMREADILGDATIHNLALEYRARHGGGPGKVDMYLFQMLEDGPAPDTQSFNTAMRAWAKEGNLDRVEAWFKRMQARKVPADFHSFQHLIVACGKAGKIAKAEETLAKMTQANVPPHPSCYMAMLQVYGDAKAYQKLWGFFEQMKAKGVSATAQTYATLLRPFSISGDLEGVDKVLSLMKADGFKPLLEPAILQLWVTVYGQLKGQHPGTTDVNKTTALKIVQEAVAEGAQMDQPTLSALEKVVGTQKTQLLVQKLNLRGHGCVPAAGVVHKPLGSKTTPSKSNSYTNAGSHKIIRAPIPAARSFA